MTWASVVAFLRRVPGWLWLALAAVLTGGLYLRERRARRRAEARARTFEELGNAALAHAGEVAAAEAAGRRERDEIRGDLAEAEAVVEAAASDSAAAVAEGGAALAERADEVAARAGELTKRHRGRRLKNAREGAGNRLGRTEEG